MRSLLRDEPSLVVKRARVAPMLPLMDVLRVNPEEQVGQPPIHSRVRQAQVDADRGQQAEEEAEAERAEAAVRLERGDRAVPVLVEEVDVLLEYGAVCVARGPVVRLGAVGGVERGGDVGARCAYAIEGADVNVFAVLTAWVATYQGLAAVRFATV